MKTRTIFWMLFSLMAFLSLSIGFSNSPPEDQQLNNIEIVMTTDVDASFEVATVNPVSDFAVAQSPVVTCAASTNRQNVEKCIEFDESKCDNAVTVKHYKPEVVDILNTVNHNTHFKT